MRYVALDIETCPLPLDDLSPAQLDRLARRVEAEARRTGDAPEEVAERVRATDATLLRICCIGVASTDDPGNPHPARTYTAAQPGEEKAMLAAFWSDLRRYTQAYPQTRWITFNGKEFDVPRLLLRTAAYGVDPVPCGLLDTYPFRHHPHCDLMQLFRSSHLSLASLCDVLGVPSPKEGAVDANSVAAAVHNGALADVATYCAADVAATLACYDRLARVHACLSRRYA